MPNVPSTSALTVAASLTFCVANFTLLAAPQAQAADQVIAFGDSLSDTGNLLAATGGIAPSPLLYYNGRFSNGPIWIDHLAYGLGVSATNYAFGGSTSGTGQIDLGLATGTAPAGVLVADNYLKQIGDYTSNGVASGSTVYTFLTGANDFSYADISSLSDPAAASAFVQGIATNTLTGLGQIITAETLANNGADTYLISNLPDLGVVPKGSALGSVAATALGQLTDAYNSLLEAGINDLITNTGADIRLLDLHGLMDATIANPAAFGLTNVTDPFYTDNGAGLASGIQTNPGDTVDGYLFFDAQHPTANGHLAFGGLAAVEFGVAIPEPSLLGLIACGATTLITRRRRA